MTQLLGQQLGRLTLGAGSCLWYGQPAAACGMASQGGLWNHLLHGVLLLSALLHTHMCTKLIFHCYY